MRFKSSKARKLASLQNKYNITSYIRTKSYGNFKKALETNTSKIQKWDKDRKKEYFKEILISFKP